METTQAILYECKWKYFHSLKLLCNFFQRSIKVYNQPQACRLNMSVLKL